MKATITLNAEFDAVRSEQASFTVALPEQKTPFAGRIKIDFSSAPHNIIMAFIHPHMTSLAQANALRMALNMLDTHFAENATPQTEWSGDLYAC